MNARRVSPRLRRWLVLVVLATGLAAAGASGCPVDTAILRAAVTRRTAAGGIDRDGPAGGPARS
jgi:hypothetical protein